MAINWRMIKIKTIITQLFGQPGYIKERETDYNIIIL